MLRAPDVKAEEHMRPLRQTSHFTKADNPRDPEAASSAAEAADSATTLC